MTSDRDRLGPRSADRSRTVAFATYAAQPRLSPDDEPLADALHLHGVDVVPAVWDDAVVRWTDFAAVVVRSCWDYHLRQDAFLAWVDRLQAAGVLLLNPPALLHWNSDKSYLRDLAARGIAVVPTCWVERDAPGSLDSVLGELGTTHAVVKPAVSASAHETWRTQRGCSPADEARFRTLVGRGRVLVQPYLDTIVTDGELSMIFVGGEFSHAVVKRPRAGDFRVQAEHGGSDRPVAPDASVVAQARQVLLAGSHGAATSLYARVDGCVIDGRFVLMELELIEPSLYIRSSANAASLFAAALVDRIASIDG